VLVWVISHPQRAISLHRHNGTCYLYHRHLCLPKYIHVPLGLQPLCKQSTSACCISITCYSLSTTTRVYGKYSIRGCVERLMQHEAKCSAVFASRHSPKCYIFRTHKQRQWFLVIYCTRCLSLSVDVQQGYLYI